jgi:hypothetical protein
MKSQKQQECSALWWSKVGSNTQRKDVLNILRRMNKDAFIVEEENLVDVDGVKFIFVNGKRSEVKG